MLSGHEKQVLTGQEETLWSTNSAPTCISCFLKTDKAGHMWWPGSLKGSLTTED